MNWPLFWTIFAALMAWFFGAWFIVWVAQKVQERRALRAWENRRAWEKKL